MTDTALPRAGSLGAFVLAARLRTLPAAASPVVVGWAFSYGFVGAFDLISGLAVMVAALALQIGANFANDLSDYRRGTDGPDRLGPPRAAALSLLSQNQLVLGVGVAFSAATSIGLYLTWIAGWPVIVIGVAGMLAAITYVGGPWPYGYKALGEVFVFVFFGLIAVSGTVFVLTDTITSEVFFAALPVSLTVTAILLVNNIRDAASDKRSGKITLAVIIGVQKSRILYIVLLVTAFVTPLILVISDSAFGYEILLVLLAIPSAVRPARTVLTAEVGREFNQALVSTARLHFLIGILFSIGLLL